MYFSIIIYYFLQEYLLLYKNFDVLKKMYLKQYVIDALFSKHLAELSVQIFTFFVSLKLQVALKFESFLRTPYQINKLKETFYFIFIILLKKVK